MNSIDLAIIGLSQQELQDRLIKTLCDHALQSMEVDDDGNPWEGETPFARKLKDAVQKRIDDAIGEIADKHITPILADKIESFSMQETNSWGEKKGKPVTFIEYLVQRAENYMVEPVDSEGRSASECSRRGSSFYGKGTSRIAYAIDKHLHYSIETAMKDALKDANAVITKGLEEACKLALKEVQDRLKVEVKTK